MLPIMSQLTGALQVPSGTPARPSARFIVGWRTVTRHPDPDDALAVPKSPSSLPLPLCQLFLLPPSDQYTFCFSFFLCLSWFFFSALARYNSGHRHFSRLFIVFFFFTSSVWSVPITAAHFHSQSPSRPSRPTLSCATTTQAASNKPTGILACSISSFFAPIATTALFSFSTHRKRFFERHRPFDH